MTVPSATRTAIFLQDACYRHRFIRSNDLSTIVERPERLRALKIGFAAAIARLEESASNNGKSLPTEIGTTISSNTDDELAIALQKLELIQHAKVDIVDILVGSAASALLDNKAVKFVHGDIDGDVYLENLVKWAEDSAVKISEGGSEIPMNLPQGDLYLCPESLEAIQGALGTVCEAVDRVIHTSRLAQEAQSNSSKAYAHPTNAFVAIRPPGHHCGEDTPCGFCFVNNVVVAAAHAHLNHKIKKVVIFDIDLHHGNGTQSLVWQINEETYRKQLESEAGATDTSPGLRICYGSLHDVLSFPCEDGNMSMVQAASVSIHGLHGQHIENIHLQQYESDEDFWTNLYPTKYSKLIKIAEEFVKEEEEDNVLVFISCGFDACEHEYSSMSRHNRRVPTSFYHRFTVDARDFANKYAKGKLISVLEGGYSDRALISGGMAHLCGLVDAQSLGAEVNEKWWNVSNLTLLEKLTKGRRGGKASVGGSGENWLDRASTIFQSIETVLTSPASKSQVPPASTRVLRQRKPAATSTAASPRSSRKVPRPTRGRTPTFEEDSTSRSAESVEEVQKQFESLVLDKTKSGEGDASADGARKVPRVILRVKEVEGP